MGIERPDSYHTISGGGTGEYEEKKSRFLGEALPVRSAKEAAAHLERIRRQYYDARHHCYACVLGVQRDQRRVSDDGEPSGTAGLPILRVIDGAGCTDLMIVVTRYFGGTLLGTGGLTRAYTEAARRALAAAVPVCMRRGELLELEMAYRLLPQVRYYLEKQGIGETGTDYTERVRCRITVPEAQAEDVRRRLLAMSGGAMGIRTIETGYYGFETIDGG